MAGNIFFDTKRLKSVGKNVIIGKTARIRYPELVEIGDNCIIDDFTYISCRVTLNSNVHISANCSLIGGQKSEIRIGEFSTTAPGVVLAAGSDDYRSGLATPMVDVQYKAEIVLGKIVIGRHCIIGANSVILPNCEIGDYTSIGALSLVNASLHGGNVYCGIPVKQSSKKNIDEIDRLEANYRMLK